MKDIIYVYSKDGILLQGDKDKIFEPLLFCDDIFVHNNDYYLKDSFVENNNQIIVYKNINKIKAVILNFLKDNLTGYYSKNYLFKYLEQKVQSPEQFALIFGDIDNFKRINSEQGHFKADIILRNLGNIITSNLKEQEYAFRFGGDEVFIISNNTDLNSHLKHYNKINKKLITECGVSCSFGIILYDKSKSIDENLAKIDSLLKHSKANGKNLITIGE